MQKPTTIRSLTRLVLLATIALAILNQPSIANGQSQSEGAYAGQRNTANTVQTEPRTSGQLLSSDELAQLQAREEQPGPEVNGGALSNEHLTYIVIALAAAVLVLVLV